MRYSRQLPLLALVALSTTALTVLAHGDDEHGGHSGGHMDMGGMGGMHGGHNKNASLPAPSPDGSVYFTYPEHKGWLYLHILTMTVSWVGIMPIAVMLFLAGSRLHLPAQALFLLTTAVGVVFSTIYNNLTPDLYPNNSHHKMGWALVFILAIQAAMGILGATVKKVTGPLHPYGLGEERAGFMAVPVDSPTDSNESHYYRRSGDSGQGSSIHRESHDEDEAEIDSHRWSQLPEINEKRAGSGLLSTEKLENALQKYAPFVFNNRVVAGCEFFYSLVARFLIPLAFTQICLGIITATGIFTGSGVFNGLAHWIKGGIFFLYGVFSLGRFLGAFADLGWAWNMKPENYATGKKSRAVSAETVESGLIFVYGISNVFLEHLAGWGQAWTHADLQHASIAFMFLGGGLCGLLIESSRVRALLNFRPSSNGAEQKPKGPSINPMPALIIFLLGILMSQHHQHSAMSTMIHTQWGALLAGAAVFRLLTYMTFYRSSTPVDTTPTRPPTEIVASFCLLAGGLVFMMSSRDVVNYVESIGVDAMFCLTVVVGFVSLLMSWIVVVMAIKGWAARRVASQSAQRPLSIDTRGMSMA